MSKFAELTRRAQERDSYWEEDLKLHFATQLLAAMQEANLSQREFAERANVSESQISQILAGSKNLSIKSMVKYAMVLGQTVTVSLEPIRAKRTQTAISNHADKWIRRIKEPRSLNRRARGRFWDLDTDPRDVFVYKVENDDRSPQAA